MLDAATHDGRTPPHDGSTDAQSQDTPHADAGRDAAPDASPDAPPDARVLPKLVINEVVLSPTHDWSGAAPAYVGTPGAGAIGSDDEYIELWNAGDTTLDLTNYVIRIKDIESKDTLLGANGTLAFSPGSTLQAVLPNGYVVVGNPTGTSASDAFITLRMPDGTIIDDVEIGGLTASRDMEGDGVGDGAPSADRNGYARGAFDEAVGRLVGTADTDVDIVDFDAMYATPGRPNVQPLPPAESVAPIMLSHTTGNNLPISVPITVTFSEPIAGLSADGVNAVTVRNGAAPIVLGQSTFTNDDRTIVLNPIGVLPFGATITVTLAANVTGIRDLAGNPLETPAVFTFTTEAAPANPATIRIHELCATPLQDWNDSEGGNSIAFDGIPGTGLVTSDDEWIELRHFGSSITNVNNYTLVIYTGPTLLQAPRLTTRLSLGNTRIFGSGTIAAVQPGDRIVVGNPVGAMPANFFLELRNANGVLIDAVEVGGNFSSSDRGGDGANNGAPGPGLDGNATNLDSEAIGRINDGQDTGDDVQDWEYQRATPGL